MKYATIEVNSAVKPLERIAIVRDEGYIDVNALYRSYLRDVKEVYAWEALGDAVIPDDMAAFIERGSVSINAVKTALDYYDNLGKPTTGEKGETYVYNNEQIKLKAPILRPRSLRDASVFYGHLALLGKPAPILLQIPAFYRTGHQDIAGPDDPILWPTHGTERLDFEAEFAIILGKYGQDIPEERARDYIFGVTLFNDITLRDLQFREMENKMGPNKGKSFRNSNILGPYIVTLDELDIHNVDLQVSFNGKVVGNGNTSDMMFNFEQLIEYLSENDALYPGDVIGSGTIAEGSCRRCGRYLMEGDVIEFSSKAMGGTLRNAVAPKPEFKKSKYPREVRDYE